MTSTLQGDVAQFVTCCASCQLAKSLQQLRASLVQLLPILWRPWSHNMVDLFTDLPRSQGNNAILSVIDLFFKVCGLIPLPKLPWALETVEQLIIHREDILLDHDPQLTSWGSGEMCWVLRTNVSLTQHPQAHCQREVLIRRSCSSFYCNHHQEEWSLFLLWIRPEGSHLSSVCREFNSHSFPGQENPRRCLQWMIGSAIVKRHGRQLIFNYGEPSTGPKSRLIGIAVKVPAWRPLSVSGSPSKTSGWGSPARSSVPGMWVCSKWWSR